MTTRLRCRLRSEQGMGLVELLVAVPLMALALGAIFSFTQLAISDSAQGTSRSRSLVSAQNGMDRITRDLRSLVPYTSEGLYMSAWAFDGRICGDVACSDAGSKWVRWNCAGLDSEHRGLYDAGDPVRKDLFDCTRAEVPYALGRDALGSAAAPVLIRNVEHPVTTAAVPVDMPIFTTWLGLVTVSLRVKTKGSPTSGTQLNDFITPRNYDYGTAA